MSSFNREAVRDFHVRRILCNELVQKSNQMKLNNYTHSILFNLSHQNGQLFWDLQKLFAKRKRKKTPPIIIGLSFHSASVVVIQCATKWPAKGWLCMLRAIAAFVCCCRWISTEVDFRYELREYSKCNLTLSTNSTWRCTSALNFIFFSIVTSDSLTPI